MPNPHPSAGFKPGKPKTGGRQKGVPNKFTKQLKDMILGALDDVGGQAYLAEQARENPTAFLALVGRVLPTTLQGPNGEGNVTIEVVTGIVRKGDEAKVVNEREPALIEHEKPH